MKPRFKHLSALTLLAVVFTIGLTFASVELPRLLDAFLAQKIDTPDVATGFDAQDEYNHAVRTGGRLGRVALLGWFGLFLPGPGPAFSQFLDFAAVEQEIPNLAQFETRMEQLRQQLRIPGMAAGIVKEGQLVWAKGFGYADLENRVEASPETPWHIASVAKTFAAVVVCQLMEEGQLGLDEPLSNFGIRLKSPGGVTVRHILTHTSERKPGTFFRYSGRLWEHLGKVISEASGRSYKDSLVERIIRPLGMTDSAPNKESESEAYPYESIRSRAAVPYRMDESFTLRRSEMGMGFYAAGGTFSSIRDMSRFDAALDSGLLLDYETTQKMFSPHASPGGESLPHGLGWFCQDVGRTRLVWHFGWHPDNYSALILKVPAKGLTFMVFANSDMLSRPFNLLRGDVLNSPAALLFLQLLVFPGEDLPEIARRAAVTNDIILKASGRKPAARLAQKCLLAFSLLVFLSAPILWTALWIVRKRRARKESRPPGRTSRASGLIKGYALLCALLGVMVMGVLRKAPFLMYWPDLPGWIDGISLEENIALALPTLLAVLAAALCILAFIAWVRKYWSILERIHFAVLAVSAAGFVLLLDHWQLVGLSYYWNYLIW